MLFKKINQSHIRQYIKNIHDKNIECKFGQKGE